VSVLDNAMVRFLPRMFDDVALARNAVDAPTTEELTR